MSPLPRWRCAGGARVEILCAFKDYDFFAREPTGFGEMLGLSFDLSILHVTFLLQFVAGPIERSSRLLPQAIAQRHVRFEDFRVGLHLVLLGLFTKVITIDVVN